MGKIQEALNSLTDVQRGLNELEYYKKYLNDCNHSISLCSSVKSDIDSLVTQHANMVNSLLLYGRYNDADEQLAQINNPSYESAPTALAYAEAPEHQKGFWEKTFNHVVYGDFSEDSTWLGVGVNIGASIVGVDAPMDFRDMVANYSQGHYFWGTVDLISLVPVVGALGEVVKPFQKGAKVLDAAGDTASNTKKVIKGGAEIIDGGGTIIKNGSKIIDGASDMKKNLNMVDALGESSSGTKKILWETSSKNKYILSDNSFSVLDKSGDVLKKVDNVEHISDFKYIKKSSEELDAARKAFNKEYKPAFLKKIAEENADDLRKIGLSDIEIEDMKKGIQPEGYEVHHKLSLDDGGENTFDNFILIDDASHDIFTGYQNTFTKTSKFKETGEATIDWVYPTGSIYIP